MGIDCIRFLVLSNNRNIFSLRVIYSGGQKSKIKVSSGTHSLKASGDTVPCLVLASGVASLWLCLTCRSITPVCVRGHTVVFPLCLLSS